MLTRNNARKARVEIRRFVRGGQGEHRIERTDERTVRTMRITRSWLGTCAEPLLTTTIDVISYQGQRYEVHPATGRDTDSGAEFYVILRGGK